MDVLDLVPIGVDSRMTRAYQSAVAESGGKALLRSSTRDTQVDLMVATVRCASVEGVAIY